MAAKRSSRVLRGMALAALALALAAGLPAAPSDEADEQALAADADYAAGMAALKAQDFAGALVRFQGALKRFPDAAGLHTELGYTLRKLGRLPNAFEHYRRALAIDPRHRGAHEYIGEAYLMANDVPSALKHVAALREICTLPCEELRELEAAVKAHRPAAPAR